MFDNPAAAAGNDDDEDEDDDDDDDNDDDDDDDVELGIISSIMLSLISLRISISRSSPTDRDERCLISSSNISLTPGIPCATITSGAVTTTLRPSAIFSSSSGPSEYSF